MCTLQREFHGPTAVIEAFHHHTAPAMLCRRAPPAPAMALQPISLLSLVLAWGCVASSSLWHTAGKPTGSHLGLGLRWALRGFVMARGRFMNGLLTHGVFRGMFLQVASKGAESALGEQTAE